MREEMFATATRNLVEEVDHGGLLIPVSSLNDVIDILTLVVKRKRFWFWQKPRHLPTDFTLNDILTGDTPIEPVITETDFIKFNGTYGDNIHSGVDAELLHSNVSLKGKDSLKLQSYFGSLKKEEVHVQKLLHESKSRVLDMSHSLIQQTKEKKRQVLGIVKERIMTTTPCSVIEEVQQAGQCGAGLSFSCPRTTKISLKENTSLSKDSNVTMEIPSHTAVAYGLIELEIKYDGCFELCLMSDTTGGFEVDGPVKRGLLGVTGASPHAHANSKLQEDLQIHHEYFHLLSSLPVTTKSRLFQQLAPIIQDPAAVRELQTMLDHVCLDQSSSALDDISATEPPKQKIQAILDLVKQCDKEGSVPTVESTSVLTAIHLIISSLDEMTNDCLAILGVCCSQAELQTMDQLVSCVSGKGELLLSSKDQTPLTEDVFEKVVHLFASSNVSLRKDGDTVMTEINPEAGHAPLLLCIAVRALASLSVC